MIYNTDRGGWHHKPNLLIDDEGFILIDHELTFPFLDSRNPEGFNKAIENFNNNSWPHFYEKHIFYSRLKSYRGSKKHLFDTFDESLRTLNITSIQDFIKDLVNNDIDAGTTDFLINYLSMLKQKSYKFHKILLGLIS